MESTLVREHPMSVNWLVMGHQSGEVHARNQSVEREIRLTRENTRLTEENQRLRTVCDDLVASSELWIRLYEEALARERDRLQKHG